MEYNTFGIIAIVIFAITSAFMADGDDVSVDFATEYEYTDTDTQEFNPGEMWLDDTPEYVTIIDGVAVSDSDVAPRAVVARMTCDEINKRIAELRDDVKSYPELKSDLDSMLGRYRTQCASTVSRRPVHNYENVNPVQVLETPEPEPEIIIEEVVPEPVVSEPEKTAEELAAAEEAKNARIVENLSKGLCGDGAKPNRYGCCAGEVFKEVEPMVFGCCPKDGGDRCLEPIK